MPAAPLAAGSTIEDVLDLGAYLARIGLRGEPSVASVHRAHVRAVPFENLDPHRGVPVSLAPEDLERKLVTERRGGYCFEQNLLLGAAFEALGARVEPLLARVRLGGDGQPRPRTHLVLRVTAGGETWLADVGFGLGTLLEPLAFAPGAEAVQSGWPFRLVADGPELVLRSVQDGTWVDLYGFVPEPVPRVDIEVSNWYTSTHPRSPFVTGFVVATHGEGTRASLRDWDGLALVEQTPEATVRTPVAREDVPDLLATRFGLPGFALGTDGRIVPAPVAVSA